ncbi:MAG: response regulator [Chlorobi bacterium]|nr:response regulator [Chlorobiota bacterium]
MSRKKEKQHLLFKFTGRDGVIQEVRYKSVIINILTISYILITLISFLINIDQKWLIWINSPVVIVLLLLNYLLYRKKKYIRLYALGFLGIGILDVFFSLVFVTSNTSWPLLWVLIIPPLAIFLLDLKWGSRLSIALFLALTGFLIFSPSYLDAHYFNEFFLFSYLFTYLFLLAISSLFVFFITKSIHQLRQANENITKANENREKFLAHLSHQIRTPLNDIMAFNEMIQKLEIPEKSRELFEMIRASSQNLVHAVGSFNRIGKISAGKKKKISKVPFDIIRHLSQLENSINRQNKDKMIIRIRTKGYLPDQVSGDPVILNQIFLSLVEGILRNTTPQHLLEVHIDATFETHGRNVNFTAVTTSNPPLPFVPEKFSQLRTLAGAGVNAISANEDLPYLNLLLCMDFCHQLNGELELTEDEENQPLKIKITLPFMLTETTIRTPTTLTEELTHEKKTTLTESNVLLVEDNPINQKIVMASLKPHVKNIDLAEDGKQALEFYGKNRYDFILMDIQIPVMDGMLVTKKIREIETSTSTHTPIIAVTANAMPGDRETCLSAGMDEYISKPFLINQLIDKMKSLLD